jgi:hypothetical protein
VEWEARVGEWLLDETQPLSVDEAWEATRQGMGFQDAEHSPLAVVLRDMTIHDTRKWFGRADVRLDALFVTAASEDQIYAPGTWQFPGIRDHDDLPIGDNGLLLYLGRPRYFLDMSIVASGGEKGKPALGEVLADNADHLGDLLGNVTHLTAAAPQAAAVTGAAAAASKLGAAALRLLQELTGNSIGLYRVTWFENRDRFGLGQHPRDTDRFHHQDLEFHYEIFEDRAPDADPPP